MAERKLKRGDHVTWHSQGNTIDGTVEKRLTGPAKIKNHEVQASPEHPEYLVKSDKTGAEAAHHADALKKQS